MRSRLVPVVVAVALATAGSTLATSAPAVAGTTTTGVYHAVTPHRVLDTRTHAPVAAHATNTAVVTGSGVPAAATSVVLTVTVVGPARSGYLTVYPSGSALPTASNLNFAPHATVANAVVSRIGAAGQVAIYNGSAGTTNLLVDVSGYYAAMSSSTGQGGYEALDVPHRALDTRTSQAVAAGGSASFTATGAPAGASAAVVNLTATAPAQPGYLTAYAADADRPGASNLNFARGATVANLAVVPLSADGRITVYNGSSGTTQLIADVTGYVRAGDPLDAGSYASLTPTRLLDTRSSRAVAAGGTVTVSTAGRAGVPAAHVAAVVLNVTVVSGTRSGYLTTYAYGTPRPTVSNLNFAAQQVVAGLVVAPVDSAGRATIYNGSGGASNVIVDVAGYLTSTAAPLPGVVSVSRYVRNVSGASSDRTTMRAEGCADAQARTTVSLLDIGAQSNTNDPASVNGVVLSSTTRGVRLSGLQDPVRLTYAQLESAIEGYLDGLADPACTDHAAATVAIGTSNDGSWTAYPATTRADDWATVVAGLRTYASTHAPLVTVVGASDIEAGFASTAAQAESWVSTYLGASGHTGFVDTGSLDGCPTTWGSTTTTCSPVFGQTGTWTIADYVKLSHSLGGTGEIRVLPQIYLPSQAVQWSVVDHAAVGGLTFAGALTEHASCPTATTAGCDFAALPPTQGWAELYHAASTITASPSVPAVTDLEDDEPVSAMAGHLAVVSGRSLGA